MKLTKYTPETTPRAVSEHPMISVRPTGHIGINKRAVLDLGVRPGTDIYITFHHDEDRDEWYIQATQATGGYRIHSKKEAIQNKYISTLMLRGQEHVRFSLGKRKEHHGIELIKLEKIT